MMNLTISLADRAGIVQKPFGCFDGSQRMLVDREMVILIELQQAPDMLPAGENGFENARFMQSPQGDPELA